MDQIDDIIPKASPEIWSALNLALEHDMSEAQDDSDEKSEMMHLSKLIADHASRSDPHSHEEIY
jgi:hypothetical protein